MTRRPILILALFAAASVAWAQQQPLTSPIYYLVTAPELVAGVPVDGALTTASGQNFKDGSYLDVLVLRSAGQETVEVRVESDDFDTYLSLFAPDGSLLDANDDVYDGDGYFASRVRAYLPTAGTYLVVVSGFGPYDLGRYTVMRGAYVPPPKVVVDAEVPGRYQGYLNEDMADMYWVTLTEPATVIATLRSPEFDTVLEVYGADGRQVAANDDFDGTDSQVIVDLPAGRYEFLVKGYWSEDYGAYTLDLDTYEGTPAVVIRLEQPGSFAGALAPGGADTYVLTLAAAALVTVDVRSTEFDSVLEAFDADGRWIDSNDDFLGSDARLALQLDPGTYEFDVTAFGGYASGAYTITFAW